MTSVNLPGSNFHLKNLTGTAAIPAVFACILAFITAGAVEASAGDPDWPFETAVAVFETVPLERSFDGTVQAVHKATVSSQTAGRIAEANYDVDDYVEAGSVLIRFTDVEQQTALKQAEANLKEARAILTEATEELRRSQNLLARELGSQRDVDRALASKEAAEARESAAGSAVEAARQQVEYTLVRAPYAGIVTQRHVEVGEAVRPGQPLMAGLSLEKLRVLVALPQRIAGLVRKKPMVEVLVGEERITPESITIFPVADPLTKTFDVRLELPEGQFGLYPGMFVKTAFLINQSERLLLPQAAVMRRSEVTAVYVVDGPRLRFRQVRLGRRFGDRIEILSGIDEGEAVALDPVAAGVVARAAGKE